LLKYFTCIDQVAVDLGGDGDHRAFDHLGLEQGVHVGGGFVAGELDIHALLLVAGDGDFAFDHVLSGGAGAVADRELGRLLDVDGRADAGLELLLDGFAVAQLGHDELVLQKGQANVGVDLRGGECVGHRGSFSAARGRLPLAAD
jgi:hypothetical protein